MGAPAAFFALRLWHAGAALGKRRMEDQSPHAAAVIASEAIQTSALRRRLSLDGFALLAMTERRRAPLPLQTYAIAYIKAPMRVASYSTLRRNLAAAIDRVNADREPLVITRDKGKPMAVLMSLDDFASYEETRHLLRSPANADRLRDAIAELERGDGKERTLVE
jgi:antitoxin YefM